MESQNGEVTEPATEGANVDESSVEAMWSEENSGAEPSTSECGEVEELKGEDGDFSPRVVKNEELKRESSTSSPRAVKNEGRKEQANPTEGLRTGGTKGKGSNVKGTGRGGKNVGKESGRSNSRESNRSRSGDKSSETIRAAGLPSMRRTKSQPGRNRGGGEREEILPEEKREPVQEKDENLQSRSARRDSRPSGEVAAYLAAGVAWVKQWVEKQEPVILAVRDYLLQLRARVEFRVKQHWPLVRAWLLLIMRVMLMLSLLGLEAAIRGFASLFRLGSAAHFLLLWCSILSFIRLSGLFNLIIVLVILSFSPEACITFHSLHNEELFLL